MRGQTQDRIESGLVRYKVTKKKSQQKNMNDVRTDAIPFTALPEYVIIGFFLYLRKIFVSIYVSRIISVFDLIDLGSKPGSLEHSLDRFSHRRPGAATDMKAFRLCSRHQPILCTPYFRICDEFPRIWKMIDR